MSVCSWLLILTHRWPILFARYSTRLVLPAEVGPSSRTDHGPLETAWHRRRRFAVADGVNTNFGRPSVEDGSAQSIGSSFPDFIQNGLMSTWLSAPCLPSGLRPGWSRSFDERPLPRDEWNSFCTMDLDGKSSEPSNASSNPSRIARCGEYRCWIIRDLAAAKARQSVLIVYLGRCPPPSTRDCSDNDRHWR